MGWWGDTTISASSVDSPNLQSMERKAFNFYKSYFDVYAELESDKSKKEYIEAILYKQFFNIEPELSGISKLAYISQKHSIDAQVLWFTHKVGILDTPPVPPSVGGRQAPSVQGKGKEEEKEKEEQGDDVYMQAWHLSITHSEFTKLSQEFWEEKSDELVQWVLNYRKNTKYKSLYLTAIKWGRAENQKNAETPKIKRTALDYSTL